MIIVVMPACFLPEGWLVLELNSYKRTLDTRLGRLEATASGPIVSKYLGFVGSN